MSHSKKDTDSPEGNLFRGLIVTASQCLKSLKRRYKEDTEYWQDREMPDNVKEDRKKKRELIKQLKGD